MKYLTKNFLKIFFLHILAASCSGDFQSALKPVPTAFGELNQIIVVCDDRIWNSPIGDTLDYYFSAAYPVLPQPEPIFDLIHFSPEDLEAEPPRKEFRTYLFIANLNEKDSPTTQVVVEDIGSEKVRRAKEEKSFNSTIGRDKWAKGQLIIYQFGYSDDDIIDYLKSNFPAIAQKVNKHDERKLEATIYQSGTNLSIERNIESIVGIKMKIPGDYFEAETDTNFVWIRRETEDLSSHIMIKKLKYTDKSQLSKDGIKAVRDSLGRKYVSSEIPDSFMKINDIDLPLLTRVMAINNNYALEGRGYWEIVNDYMGGAFVSYLVHDSDSNELVFMDGFIYAPGKDKRNFLQQVEYILKTVSF